MFNLLNKGCFNNSNLPSKDAMHLSKVFSKIVNFICLSVVLHVFKLLIYFNVHNHEVYFPFPKESREPVIFISAPFTDILPAFFKFPFNKNFYIRTKCNWMLHFLRHWDIKNVHRNQHYLVTFSRLWYINLSL